MTPKHFLLAASLTTFTVMSASAQSPDWENQNIVRINKEAPHCVKMPFPTKEGALKKQLKDQIVKESIRVA